MEVEPLGRKARACVGAGGPGLMTEGAASSRSVKRNGRERSLAELTIVSEVRRVSFYGTDQSLRLGLLG